MKKGDTLLRVRDRYNQKQHLAYYHASDILIEVLCLLGYAETDQSKKGVIIILNRYGLVICTGHIL